LYRPSSCSSIKSSIPSLHTVMNDRLCISMCSVLPCVSCVYLAERRINLIIIIIILEFRASKRIGFSVHVINIKRLAEKEAKQLRLDSTRVVV
jgi:hypothetical protein